MSFHRYPKISGGSQYWQDAVPTTSALPPEATTGEIRYVIAAEAIYVYTGTEWEILVAGTPSSHSSLTNLEADDHTQYALLAGRPNQTFTGNLAVTGSMKVGIDEALPSAAKVGSLRYRINGNKSHVDMCMQTNEDTFVWVNIITNTW